MEASNNTESSPGDHFEQQFAKKEVFKTEGGPTEVVDIEALAPKDGVPVLIAPGWGETPRTHKKSLKIIYDDNRRAITVGHPRRGNSVAPEAEFPMAVVRKAQSLIGVMDQKNLEKVDVIAHSEGAIDTIVAATLYPEKFRNIVLVNPGGLIGKDTSHQFIGRSMISLARDFTQIIKSSQERGPLIKSTKEMAKYVAKNPKRAIEEANAMAKSDILEMIKNLHESGIGISVVTGVDDPIFPMSRMTEVLRISEGVIDGFYSVKGGHNKLLADPRYTKAALNALDDLRHKYQGNLPAQPVARHLPGETA